MRRGEEADAHAPHESLQLRRDPFRFEGNVEEIVETQDGLEEDENDDGFEHEEERIKARRLTVVWALVC